MVQVNSLTIGGGLVMLCGAAFIVGGFISYYSTEDHNADWECKSRDSCTVENNGHLYGIYYSNVDDSLDFCVDTVYPGLLVKRQNGESLASGLTQTCFDRDEVHDYIQENMDREMLMVAEFRADSDDDADWFKITSSNEGIYVADLTENDWGSVGSFFAGVGTGIGALICCCFGCFAICCGTGIIFVGEQQQSKIVVQNFVTPSAPVAPMAVVKVYQ